MNTNLKSLILLLASGVSFSMESSSGLGRENIHTLDIKRSARADFINYFKKKKDTNRKATTRLSARNSKKPQRETGPSLDLQSRSRKILKNNRRRVISPEKYFFASKKTAKPATIPEQQASSVQAQLQSIQVPQQPKTISQSVTHNWDTKANKNLLLSLGRKRTAEKISKDTIPHSSNPLVKENLESAQQQKLDKKIGPLTCEWFVQYRSGEGVKKLVSSKLLFRTNIFPSSSYFKVLPTPGGNDLSLLCSIFGKKKGNRVTAEIDDDLKKRIEFKGEDFYELKQHVLDRIRKELSNTRKYVTVTTGDIVSINHTVRNLMEEGLARAKTVNLSEYKLINNAEGFIDKLERTSDMLPDEMIPVLNIIFPKLPTIVLMNRKDKKDYAPQGYLPTKSDHPPIFIYHEGQNGSDYSRLQFQSVQAPQQTKTISQLVKK